MRYLSLPDTVVVPGFTERLSLEFSVLNNFPVTSLVHKEQRLEGVSVDITPLLTSKEPFCSCAVGEVSWLWEWKVYGLLSLILAGPSLLPCLSNHSCLGILVHRWKISTCFALRDQLRRAWQPTPIFLSGESHGQRSLEGYIFHRVAKSWTWIKQHSMHAYTHTRKHTHTHTNTGGLSTFCLTWNTFSLWKLMFLKMEAAKEI